MGIWMHIWMNLPVKISHDINNTTVTSRATAVQKAAIIMIQKGGRGKYNRVQRKSKIKKNLEKIGKRQKKIFFFVCRKYGAKKWDVKRNFCWTRQSKSQLTGYIHTVRVKSGGKHAERKKKKLLRWKNKCRHSRDHYHLYHAPPSLLPPNNLTTTIIPLLKFRKYTVRYIDAVYDVARNWAVG